MSSPQNDGSNDARRKVKDQNCDRDLLVLLS